VDFSQSKLLIDEEQQLLIILLRQLFYQFSSNTKWSAHWNGDAQRYTRKQQEDLSI